MIPSHIPHDIQITVSIATGIVVLLLQCTSLYRSFTDRKIARNTHHVVTHIDATQKAIATEVAQIQHGLKRIQAITAGRASVYGRRAENSPTVPGGRRASDPAPMRKVPPEIDLETMRVIQGEEPREVGRWPIDDSP